MSNNFIYGFHVIESQIEANSDLISKLFILQNRKDKRVKNLIDIVAQKKNIKIQFIDSQSLFYSMFGDNANQGVAAEIKEIKSFNESDLFEILENSKKQPFLLILDRVQDPHNLGACLRTADAAGVDAVISAKDNSASITAAVRKVASGAAENIPFIQVTNIANTIKKLKDRGIWIVGGDDKAEESLYNVDLKIPIAIVMGAEENGLRRLTKELCDFLVNIPMNGSVSSLNVSVASGVFLFEVVRQRIFK